jgi:hypothetical protein
MEMAHQVGHERQRALQDAHQRQLAASEVGVERAPSSATLADLLLVDDIGDVAVGRSGTASCALFSGAGRA